LVDLVDETARTGMSQTVISESAGVRPQPRLVDTWNQSIDPLFVDGT